MYVPVHQPQGAFHELGGHAEQAGNDHPEGRPGSTEGDGVGHAGNVSYPYGSGQGGGKGLEMAYFTVVVRIVEFTAYDVQSVLETPNVDKAHVYGEDGRADDQPGEDEWNVETSNRHRKEDDRLHECGDGLENGLYFLVNCTGWRFNGRLNRRILGQN